MRFADREVDVKGVITRLETRWGTTERGVFIRSYTSHYGSQVLKDHAHEAWRRIAQDYIEYCSKGRLWLPYYVLRTDYSD